MKILEKIQNLIYQTVEKLENQKIGLIAWLTTFLLVVFIRNFLEVFSTGVNFSLSYYWPFFFFHSAAFFLFAFLSFILLTYFVTREKIEKISKISLWLAPILLLPPVLQLIVFRGQLVFIKYTEWQASSFLDIVKIFSKYILFGPLGPFYFGQFTPYAKDLAMYFIHSYGVRVEFCLLLILITGYFFIKSRSVWKTVAGLFFSSLLMFIFVHFPYIFSALLGLANHSTSFFNISKINPYFEWNYVLFALYFVLIFILSIIWFYIYDKNKLFALIKNLRIFRIGLYLGAFYYGLYLAKPSFSFSFFDWLLVVIANLAIVFSWLFAVGSNDLVDEQADRISKPDRPLPSGKFSHSEIKSLNIIFRIISYICALVAGYTFFITILVRSAISYLYSNPPFRLKKIPILSTFCIAAGVLIGVMGGYLLLSTNSIYNFPPKLILLILVVFTLSMNVIHIKDYEGDKKDKIWTLPVLFGLENGKIIIGLMSAASFIIVPIFYPQYFKVLILPSIISAALSYYLINRPNFKEWPVLLLYCIYAVPVALYLYH